MTALTAGGQAAIDSQILKAASANSDDWDDRTWAAWFRAAERAQVEHRSRETRLEAEVAELANKLDTAERQNAVLDARCCRLTAELAEARRLLDLREAS
ncbi:hypothetical protein ABZ508_26480 [Streptomyces lavendulocolor]|uniref:Uncharacterized protein n=1 Tax=Streptomyces lavendulocolor TaxID=67316 RepID=A0ABV2WC52_9ACTN